MPKPTKTTLLRKTFDLANVSPPYFYGSKKEINENAGLYPYTHLMRRAWGKMDLDGIYCVENRPTVYFKEVKRFDEETIRKLHQKFWNQGTGTLLVVASSQEVRVYSGLVLPAKENESLVESDRLVKILNIASDAIELRQFLKRVETGAIYQEKAKSFPENGAVDHYLLENLKSARDSLVPQCASKEDYIVIHRLLGRMVFTSYLTDRKIIGPSYFKKAGAPQAKNLRDILNLDGAGKVRKVLFKLFDQLQEKFNGSMFDDSAEEEREQITDRQIEILRDFLNGEKIGSAQIELFSWAYDFSVIPVETISAIYEEFLSAESPDGQRESGAYYTPKHLAEMVADVAVEGYDSLLDKRILDPACGSGIFLVVLFNRLAEEWRRKHPRRAKHEVADALIEILQTRICGVDKMETACRIACFSLYLALLDQLRLPDIDDLQKRRGKVLPPLLALKKDGYKRPEKPVIFEGNFFSEDLPIPASDFDLVIGNPPWVGRNQPKDSVAEEWCFSPKNPYIEDAPGKKSDRQQYFYPQHQIAHAFMWKTPLHLKEEGKCCLLLPSKVLLNKTDAFQGGWFSKVCVERIVQLADWRFILFENAICPAIIARFGRLTGGKTEYSIDYEIPKVDRVDPRRGVVPILPEDRKRVKMSEVARSAKEQCAPLFWKRLLWGTNRDSQLLDYLLGMPKLGVKVGTPQKPDRWIRGQGFIRFIQETYDKNPEGYCEPRPIWWSRNHKYINARNPGINLILSPIDCDTAPAEIKSLYRSPNKEIFQPPMVILNQGFTKKAYCAFPVLFRDALQSISGPPEDSGLLKFLSAVLNSNLAIYFLFHTSANWGTERDKVHLWELLNFPFPFPEDTEDPGKSRKIVKKASSLMKKLEETIEREVLGREYRIEEAKRELEPLIFEYYGITPRERMLIEDTINVVIPSSTPGSFTTKIPTLSKTRQEQRKKYANLLCEVLNTWAKRQAERVSARFLVSNRLNMGIFTLTMLDKTSKYEEVESQPEMDRALKRIQKLLPQRSGRFAYLRGFSVFEGKKLHIVKPLALRHWTRTAALNEADEIASAILSSGRTA